MIHLRTIQRRGMRRLPDRFPFNVSVIATLDEVQFTSPVTFLVGENGSGKSTLLEAIAAAVGSITVGSEGVQRDPTLEKIRELAQDFKLVWTKRTRKGFFMRSEDFFGFARRMDQARKEMERYMKEVDEEYTDRSDYARGMAKMA